VAYALDVAETREMPTQGNGLVGRRTRRFLDMHTYPMWARVLLHVAAILLLILGFIGFFVPILQGFLFTFLGLIVLASVNPWLRRRTDRWLDAHPRMDRLYWKTVRAWRRIRGKKDARSVRQARQREQASERQGHAAARGSA
jgi:uncharacterized membrane protein YbaN (DUF454 family)